jgi:hypothetical protein
MPNPITAQYPSAIVTDSQLPVATGGFSTTLTGDIDFSVTTIPVGSISADVPVLLRIENEIILAVTKSGSNFTGCVRGHSGTTAVAHSTGAEVFGYIFAHHFNQLASEVKAIETALGENLSNVSVPDLDPDPSGTYGDVGTYYATFTVNSKGQVTTASQELLPTASFDMPAYVYYRAAVAQGSNAFLAFSTKSTDQPTASVVSDTNNVFGVADFPNAGLEVMWEHFLFPEDTNQSGGVEVLFEWIINATSGTVVWEIEATTRQAGDLMEPTSWAWSESVSTTLGAGLNIIRKSTIVLDSTLQELSDKELIFKIKRGTDTATEAARLLAVRFRFLRSYPAPDNGPQ